MKKKAYVLKVVDTKAGGDKFFMIVDDQGQYLKFGVWKTKKECIDSWEFNFWGIHGYELQKQTLTEWRTTPEK